MRHGTVVSTELQERGHRMNGGGFLSEDKEAMLHLSAKDIFKAAQPQRQWESKSNDSWRWCRMARR